MILMLNIHFTRVSDLVIADHIITTPPIPLTPYRDGFGNWCSRIVAPPGDIRISTDALVNDSGLPDGVDLFAPQHAVEDLPAETLVFLLGSRYCETDRLTEKAWALFGQTPPGWPRVKAICDFVHGHITFGYQHARATRTALEAFNERMGVCRDYSFAYFKGTGACLAALYAAGRYDELLALLEKARFKWWHDRRWGVKALAAQGKKAEAVRYAEASRGLNEPGWQIAQACEEILLSSGFADEAYERYALDANQGTTNLATFRAISKKYQYKSPEQILHDLAASTPGAEGKWFAAAKDAGLFDLAIELVNRSPTDPRTLTGAARDFAEKRPEFAIAAGLAALRWISLGHGYEITGSDVVDAYTAVMRAATQAGTDPEAIKAQIREMTDGSQHGNPFVQSILVHHLSG